VELKEKTHLPTQRGRRTGSHWGLGFGTEKTTITTVTVSDSG
jgi:hypothetical protein